MKQNTKKEKPKLFRVKASLMGKTAAVVPCDDRIEIYTTGTWFILICLWIFAAAFFTVATFSRNMIVILFVTFIGGVVGYFFATRLYLGRLTKTFMYDDINCVISDVPELTIVHGNEQLFVIKMLTKAHINFFVFLERAIKNSNYSVRKTSDRYYIEKKNDKSEE